MAPRDDDTDERPDPRLRRATRAQAKKPVAKKPAAKKPVAKKPVAKKPAVKKPVVKKPVVKKPTNPPLTPVVTRPTGTFSTLDRPGTRIPGITLDPGIVDRIQLHDVPPLLLLPLRLEYRVVERQAPVRIAEGVELPKSRMSGIVRGETAIEPGRGSGRATGGAGKRVSPVQRKAAERAETERRAARSGILGTPVKPGRLVLETRTEIWFRWYPDEGFAEKGVPAPAAPEREALERFDAAIGSRVWHDASDPEVAAAWQTLARDVGAPRAVHLMRHRGRTPAGTEERFGRIAALPRRVALLALDADGGLTPLGEGAEIASGDDDDAVAYTPGAIEQGGWLSDFGRAVEVGMALKLAGVDQVQAALAADWIVAVGIHSGDGAGEVEALLGDAVANGNFGFLPQDSATNNSAGSRSAHGSPATDPLGYLRDATQEERGEVAAEPESAAANLAEALGIDAATVRRAVHASDGAFEDARAMLRVVGPILLDAGLDGATRLDGVDENAFIDLLATAVSARGPLPTLRFGNNPYGLLPVTRTHELEVEPGTGDTAGKVHNFLVAYTSFLRGSLANRADELVPVLEPDDPEATDKLERILEQYPVSRRLEVGDVRSDSFDALGCPYVASPARPPADYLKSLRTRPLDDLPDPDENDGSWPLLYRLARLSLEASTVLRVIREEQPRSGVTLRRLEAMSAAERAVLPGRELRRISIDAVGKLRRAPERIPPQAFRRIQVAAADFAAALERLEQIAGRPDGVARLETLLMETVDLFQHRFDAFATGLAYQRLLEQRRRGATGLQAGYYGFLSKLRPESATGSGDGYIQAPSLPQATTAAVLRSAHRHHRDDGAFAIDLPSRRVRRALAILGMQRQGLSMAEILGLRGERWLHDQKKDVLIPKLRERFPLRNETPPEAPDGAGSGAEPVRLRLFDGMAFLEGSLAGFGAAERTVIGGLRAALADDLDAVSDLVMCEAVHQRSLGQAEAANAWLQVLAGEPVPGEPIFLRTQRHGQGSSHRVTFLVPAVPAGAAGSTASPREIAEPALAAFATEQLGDLSGATVRVTLTRRADGATASVDVGLVADLGMRPLDLVVGGESELRVRLRQHVIRTWQMDPGPASSLGPLPAVGVQAFVNREVTLAVDFAAGAVDVREALARAAEIRALAQRGRPLETTDLSAAASPDTPLTEEAEIQVLADAAADLRQRASELMTRLEADRGALTAAAGTFTSRAREARRAADAGEPEPAVRQALVRAELARQALAPRLIAAASYSLPEALRAFSTEEVIAAPELFEEAQSALNQRLVDARRALDAAVSEAGATATTRAEARGQVRRLVEALRSALDGEGLPVLPPITRRPETTPLLGARKPAAELLGAWAAVRESVTLPLTVAAHDRGISAFPVLDAATADDPDAAEDERGEEEAPSSRHFGVFLGRAAAVERPQRYAGVVCDEWVEQRPSQTQMSGLALNYDSPQSEPPHCLLLCVPARPGMKRWSHEAAAGMVVDTIQWMKARALSSDDHFFPGVVFPTANQIPYTAARKARIPAERYQLGKIPGLFDTVGFIHVKDAARLAVGAEKIGLHEIRGRHGRKE